MSWRPDGKKAMWMEGQRSGGPARIRVVNLPDYQPAAPVAAKSTPDPVSYGSSDLSVVKQYASASHDIDVKAYGRPSGYIQYRSEERRVGKECVSTCRSRGASVRKK